MPKPDAGLNEKLKFHESEYLKAFKNSFGKDNFSAISDDSSFQYPDTLKDFYSSRNFEPLFIKDFEQHFLVDSLLAFFKRADEHGLDPEQYHLSQIRNEFSGATNDSIGNPNRYVQLANTEIFISDAILKYAYHLRYGVVNPAKILSGSYFIPVVDSSKRNIFEPLRQDNILQYLKDIQPKSEKYKKLQAALKHYNSYENFEWKEIPLPNKKIEPGDNDSSLVLIAERLIKLECLDTSKIKIKNYAVYDSLLVNPVKKFQRMHGLNDDGVIGKGTVEKLNVTPDEYINKIKINLERFRWNDYSDSARYIIVNIPDFRLHVVENKKELYNIKVCTGKKRPANYEQQLKVYNKTRRLWDKPDDWQTPCMYAEISYLVLNPTWNVPPSIIREEILSGIKKDSSYLDRKNFKVYRDGAAINNSEVQINELALNNIPYKIVQDAGDGNALGKIKFMFKNPFGVYLHDTPSRAAFNLTNRAVSHGCVRVEKPLQLSEFILRDNTKWNIDFLKLEIGQKVNDKSIVSEYYKKRNSLRKNSSYGKTTEVKLDNKIPLFIDYFTAWVDDNGEVNFRDDVYRQDKILEEILFPKKELQQALSLNN